MSEELNSVEAVAKWLELQCTDVPVHGPDLAAALRYAAGQGEFAAMPAAGEGEREADMRARFVSLDECPVGLFWGGATLCNKTEYRTERGAIEAHIVSTGELFWGEKPQTAESQCASLVVPIDIEFAERVLDVTLAEQNCPAPSDQEKLVEALKRCRALVQQHNHRQNEKVEDVVRIVNRALGEPQS